MISPQRITAAAAGALALAVMAGVTQAADASQAALSPAVTVPGTATQPGLAGPHTGILLYTQDNHWSGTALVSQNFGGLGYSYDCQAADDFTVPKGHTWVITQVDAPGEETGVPASEAVFFYKNKVNAKKQDVPGTLVKKQTLKGKHTGGSLVFSGITGVRLAAGHYWVSVQANLTYGKGEWYWATRTKQSGSPAVFENPINGFNSGCTTWAPQQSCDNSSGPDLMFALYGSSTT